MTEPARSGRLPRKKAHKLEPCPVSDREVRAALEKRVNALDSRHGNLMLSLRGVFAKTGLEPAHHNNG